ncbi:hypothetical protein [Ferruginibacter sp.]|nr:hypothetical protein [Ferruginibacter sp.]
MKTNVFLNLIVVSAILFIYVSCKKENTQVTTPSKCDSVCIVTGSYNGTYTNQLNQTAQLAFVLGNNGFFTGAATLAVSSTSFGGYSNTCDSLKMQSWNSINSSYYSFAGKFSSNRTVVTGVYKNLTTISEVGTFSVVRQ